MVSGQTREGLWISSDVLLMGGFRRVQMGERERERHRERERYAQRERERLFIDGLISRIVYIASLRLGGRKLPTYS